MAELLFLDTGPLGMIAHPRANPEIAAWLMDMLSRGATVLLPEIADYEVRRELLRAEKKKSLKRLDELKSLLEYVPITTVAMLKAAELWAETRRAGKPTADDRALDGDVILAAQALTFRARAAVTVVTDNVAHLGRFVSAQHWRAIR